MPGLRSSPRWPTPWPISRAKSRTLRHASRCATPPGGYGTSPARTSPSRSTTPWLSTCATSMREDGACAWMPSRCGPRTKRSGRHAAAVSRTSASSVTPPPAAPRHRPAHRARRRGQLLGARAGKTAMTYILYSALKQLGEVEQMLVLAPISAHEAWKTEPALMYRTWRGTRLHVGPGRAGAAEVIVTNYERLEYARPPRCAGVILPAPTAPSWSSTRLTGSRPAPRASAAPPPWSCPQRHTGAACLPGHRNPTRPQDLARVLELAYPGHGFRLAARTPTRSCRPTPG